MPKVAIVTRTRDRPLFLARAMRSVLAQTFNDSCWVIVNDGGAVDPVERIADQAKTSGANVIVHHSPGSLGMEAAANKALALSSSDLVAIHDDDDTWWPEFLAATSAELDGNPACVGVVTHLVIVTEEVTGGNINTRKERVVAPGVHYIQMAALFAGNLFPPISLLFRRNAWDRAGRFDETLPVLGDWDFNLRLILQGDISIIERPLARYHQRPQASARDGNSVNAGRALHDRYDALIRNRGLRKAVLDGQLSPGLLLNMPQLMKAAGSSMTLAALAHDILRRRRPRFLTRAGSALQAFTGE